MSNKNESQLEKVKRKPSKKSNNSQKTHQKKATLENNSKQVKKHVKINQINGIKRQ